MYAVAALWLALPLLAAEERPPEWVEGPEREVVLQVGQRARVELAAYDALGRPLRYQAAALPKNAVIVPPKGRGPAALEWTPTPDDVGAQDLEITADSGGAQSTQRLHLSVEQSWRRLLTPAVAYTAYVPNTPDTWGVLQGVSIQLRLYSWLSASPRPGPAVGRVYLAFDILSSSKAEVSTALDLAAGLQLSLESAPARSWLIPHYGLEFGALFSRQLSATVAVVRPIGGVAIWWSTAFTIDLDLGYALPLSGAEFDALRGLRGRLGLSLALW